MIRNFGTSVGNARMIYDRIIEKGAAENFQQFEIGMLAREILKEVWSKNQLSKWFPINKPKIEDSTSQSSQSGKNDGKKDTEETYPDKGFVSQDEKIPEEKFWKPNNEEHELTKKRLEKITEENKAKDSRIEELERRSHQLEEVTKKHAFKPATEVQGETYEITVDGINIEHFAYVKLESVLSTVVSSLRNRGWKNVEIWVRNLPN